MQRDELVDRKAEIGGKSFGAVSGWWLSDANDHLPHSTVGYGLAAAQVVIFVVWSRKVLRA